MTFKEYLDIGTFDLPALFEVFKNNMKESFDQEYDASINGIIINIIQNYIFPKYYSFTILYPTEYLDWALPEVIIGNFPNLANNVRQLQLTSSDYFSKLSNWGYSSQNENVNEVGYDGYDASGIFNKSKSNTNSKNFDALNYVLQFNQPINSALNILSTDLEKLLQTIYLPK